MDEEIERLTVAIESDITELVDGVDKGVKKTEGSLQKLEKTGKGAFDKSGKGAKSFTGSLAAITVGVTALITALNLVAASVKKVAAVFINFAKAAIASNKQFETFTTQFETLLGSTDKARQRIEELTQFGIETPFELPEIVEASRVLQVFGGNALSTGENLRMIGDIAAGVNRPFSEVALWTGRMYDAMKSGRPFGEAAARLQEMGALSGQARQELERLQKEGATGQELWAAFNEQVGSKFAGNMERLSKTLGGIQSNLVDFRDNLIRIGGIPLFEKVKEQAQRFLDLISDPKRTTTLKEIATLLGEISATLSTLIFDPILDAIEDIDPENLDDLSAAIEDATMALDDLKELNINADINGLIQLLTILIDTFTIVSNTANSVSDRFGILTDVILPEIKDAVIAVIFPIANLIDALADLNDISLQLTGDQVVDFTRSVADATETAEQRLDKFQESLRRRREARRRGREAGQEVVIEEPVKVTDYEAEKKKLETLDKFFTEFMDLQDETNKQIEESEKEHKANMLKIVREAADARKEAEADAIEQLADLEEETAKERAAIIKDTRQELAQLEKDTDQSLKQERDNFQRDELRETEDHLRDMRRLRLNFLDNLEDAVSARDAGRVRDLQRQFARENQEQQSDFQTKQQREKADNEQRLAEIRQGEIDRAAEIMAAQQQQLADLRIHEQERRTEINNSLQEQLQAINEAAAKAQVEEIQSYIQRQQELNQALADRLAQVAKELADEDEITRAGAQSILETLNEFYGAGGEIDKLMDDYDKRQRNRAQAREGFKGVEAKNVTIEQINKVIGSIPSFATGGSMVARKPTLAMFGEAGPEMAQFTPLNQAGGGDRPQQMQIEFSGSAPPGIRAGDREQIAGIVVQALREAGMR